MSKTKTETYSANLKVQLTVEEVAERADRAAAKIAERDQKEEEQKAANKHAKSVIESIDAEIRLLSNEVRSRASWRETLCERRWDYKAGTVTEVRTDTDEEISSRRMTDSERQMELPLVAKPDAEAS
jgi:hypothetical protein